MRYKNFTEEKKVQENEIPTLFLRFFVGLVLDLILNSVRRVPSPNSEMNFILVSFLLISSLEKFYPDIFLVTALNIYAEKSCTVYFKELCFELVNLGDDFIEGISETDYFLSWLLWMFNIPHDASCPIMIGYDIEESRGEPEDADEESYCNGDSGVGDSSVSSRGSRGGGGGCGARRKRRGACARRTSAATPPVNAPRRGARSRRRVARQGAEALRGGGGGCRGHAPSPPRHRRRRHAPASRRPPPPPPPPPPAARLPSVGEVNVPEFVVSEKSVVDVQPERKRKKH
ncbi:LOW QUALITY PROTEIN: Protein of unknown function [Gryllus bimaculatus]|nr:LOW QUALITY PROTEIN: Protein of unknown function [Gryllus bimaculatus]